MDSCLFELYLSGVSYYVLPSDFVVHQSHAYAEQARAHERRYNRKLYADFREETCFRYLDQMVSAGELATPKAKNMLGECKKVRPLALTSIRLCDGRAETATDQGLHGGRQPARGGLRRRRPVLRSVWNYYLQ